MEQVAMTKEAEQQVHHALNALGQTIKDLNDAGIDPPALATALGSVMVNYISVMSALIGVPKEQVMPKLLESIDALQDYSDKVYADVVAHMGKKDGDDEQQ